MNLGPSTAVRVTLGAIAVIAMGIAIYFTYPHYQTWVSDLLAWVEGTGYWAPVFFILIVVAAVVLLLPGLLFSLGAGFMFGVVKGVAVMWIATNIGAAIAFLLGRHGMGERFARYVQNHARMERFNTVLQHEGWKVVMLTRMVPFFPFKLSNYIFGLAGFSLKHFCAGTAIGIIPITIFNVYTGSLARDVSTIAVQDTPRTPLQWALNVGGLIVAGVFFFFVTRLARKALNAEQIDRGT